LSKGTYRFFCDTNHRIDARFDVVAVILDRLEIESRREWNNQVDLRTVTDLGKALSLRHGFILFELVSNDAVDVIVRDLQEVILLTQVWRIDAVDYSLVVMKIVERVLGDAKVLKDAFFDVEHGVVIGVERLEFPVRDGTRVRDTVGVHVKEGHENTDDQAFRFVGWVAQGVRPALDLHHAFIGMKVALIENDSVCG